MLPVGHTGWVLNAQFSPDGKKIITTSTDNTAKIWDASSGVLLSDLVGHSDKVLSAQFSTDSKNVFTISNDSTIKVWNVASGMVTATIRESSKKFSSAKFGPDGTNIITASEKSFAIIWDKDRGIPIDTIGRNQPGVCFAQYNSDGKKAIIALLDRTARIWDVQSRKFITILKGHSEKVIYAGFSPANADDSAGGKYIITVSSDNSAILWNANGDSLFTFKIPGKKLFSAWFSRDASKIYMIAVDGTAMIWNTYDRNPINKAKEFRSGINSTGFNIDGSLMITASDDGTATIWNTAIGKNDKIILNGHRGRVLYAQFSPDGKNIVTASNDGTAKVWDTKGKLLLDLKGHTSYFKFAQFSPDGKKIVTASNDGTARIWDAEIGNLVAILKGHKGIINTAQFSPDSKKIVTASSDKTSRTWEVSTGNLLITFAGKDGHAEALNFAQFSPANADDSLGGKYIVTASDDKTIKIWDAAKGVLYKTLAGHKGIIFSAQFSPDGKKIISASRDFSAIVWNVQKGIAVDTLKEQVFKAYLRYAGFSPDGKKVIAAYDQDNTAKIWDIEKSMVTDTLKGHANTVLSSQFDNSGNMVVTASWDHSAKIWDVPTGACIQTLDGHKSLVNSAQFSPDNKKIVTTSNDNTAKVWDAATGKCLYTFFAIDSTDYLVVDNASHYDGSEIARKLLHFTCCDEVIGLDQVKDQLWIPGLTGRINMGDSIDAVNLDSLNICGLTPLVQDISLGDEYHFKILPRRGGIGETVLSVNGIEAKRYNPEQIKTETGGYELVIKKNELDSFLVAGKENPVTVKAYTADNAISSRGGVVGANKSVTTSSIPNLYAVIVGVSDYKGNEIDLKYAAKDAGDFSRAVSSASRKLLNTDGKEHVFTYNLTTASERYLLPKKDSIRAVLDSIGHKSTANDILLLFFAGHGKMVKTGDEKQYYFLTADASSLSGIDTFKHVGISTEELMEWTKPQNIKAQKRVLIFDACNSGQAINDFVQMGNKDQNFITARGAENTQQVKAIDKLNEKAGFFILSASSSDQNAYEMTQFSQGLLTYSLLKAIKQNPAILFDNKYLNIQRWFIEAGETVSQTIKQLTENEKRQDPQIISNTNFDIGVVDKEVMANIILSKEKPLFAASNFQNSDEDAGGDDLDLGKMINQQLSEISSKISGNSILYIATTNSPDAYSLSGRYDVKDSTVTVRISIRQNKTVKFRFEVAGNKEKLTELATNIAVRAADWTANKK